MHGERKDKKDEEKKTKRISVEDSTHSSIECKLYIYMCIATLLEYKA